MITSDLVDRACSEVHGYPDDRMMTEFDVFFKEQPSICDFITELTSESSLPSESVGRIRTLNGEFQFDAVEKALCNFFRPQATTHSRHHNHPPPDRQRQGIYLRVFGR